LPIDAPLTITQALHNVETPMTLQRGAQLSGTVADATTGTPLAGIRVEVRNPQGEVRDAMTDAQGRYSVEGLPIAAGTTIAPRWGARRAGSAPDSAQAFCSPL
jgi:uncharacterized protein (DUF2345 family)